MTVSECEICGKDISKVYPSSYTFEDDDVTIQGCHSCIDKIYDREEPING